MSATQTSLRLICAMSVAACLLPAGVALAQQQQPQVRIAADEAPVMHSRRPGAGVLTTVSSGGVYNVIHMSGDPYAHRDGNWYLVSLPPDGFGRKHMGWVSGEHVQELPPVLVSPGPRPDDPRTVVLASRPSAGGAAPMPAAAAGFVSGAPAPTAAAAAEPEPVNVPDVVVHFAFDKSDLTIEARSTLDCAMEMMTEGRAMAFAIEGHADSTGPEGYNEKLGQARAESVRSYLIEQHHIAADTIRVMSYGERQPAASNDTADGRAMNRRVVVKVGG